MDEEKTGLQQLLELNVNEFTEQKKNLTYLSWAHAWKEFIKIHPEATYEILKDKNGLPYFGTGEMGYMCYTTVTVGELTHPMWLPAMNGANKTMLDKAYKYKTKYGDKSVEPISMFDINKTIMRCLTKNLAMFGLGLYIYAGEDLPEQEPEPPVKTIVSPEYEKIWKSAKVAFIRDGNFNEIEKIGTISNEHKELMQQEVNEGANENNG
jgi:hypothetical protein